MNSILKLNRIHHVSLICSNFEVSRKFYTEILGLKVIQEIYRSDRDSFKLDLALNGVYILELFSFPKPPERLTMPEASGFRHLAFEVDDITNTIAYLGDKQIKIEPVRTDEHTHKRFTFISDPDGAPIEFYEK